MCRAEDRIPARCWQWASFPGKLRTGMTCAALAGHGKDSGEDAEEVAVARASWAVVTQETRERAARAAVFNYAAKILPKAPADLQTTLCRESSCMLAGTHKCSLGPGPWLVRCWQPSGLWSMDTKTPRKSEILSITAFFPVQLAFNQMLHLPMSSRNPWEQLLH